MPPHIRVDFERLTGRKLALISNIQLILTKRASARLPPSAIPLAIN